MFLCFICNYKFRSHEELQQHIKKRWKSSAPKQIVQKHNDKIHREDENKCPMCTKITNQVSLSHHINIIHKPNEVKCDSCGQELGNRETLIEHIVHNHTGGRIWRKRRGGVLTTDDCKRLFLRISSRRFPSLPCSRHNIVRVTVYLLKPHYGGETFDFKNNRI